MAHEHQVKDIDLHFIIDPNTRTIKNNSGKIVLMQYDHQSEVFTFEIPRYIDAHDMSVCNDVRIHYINIGSSSNQTPICGVYEISDLQIDPDNNERVICSWLLTNQTTQLEGTLSFIIRFSCVTGVTIDYSWSTAIYSGIIIAKSINNSEIIIENTADILEQWKNSIKEDIASDLEVSAKTLGISGASSGQIPVIKSTGKNGAPVEWESVDMPEQVQSDWNQNDETQPDYVKNRPFYADDPVETVLLEETTVSFSKNGQVYIACLSPYTGFFPDEGKIYNVNWDGSIYQCTCYLDGSIPTLGVLGNPGPFSIAFLADPNSLGIVTKTANSHTISISGFTDKIVQIDPKYIPTDALDNVLCVNLSMGEGGTITADKTFAEITEAVGSEMCVVARFSSGEMFYLTFYGDTFAKFSQNNGIEFVNIYCNSSDTWEVESYILNASDVGAIPSPTTATVGQTIIVKAVNANGVPTEWEAADMPSGGGGIYGLLEQYDMFEIAHGVLDSADLPSRVVITEDSGSNAFDVDGIIVWTDIKSNVSYTSIAFNNHATVANPASQPYHYGLSHGIGKAFNLYLCGANNTFLQLLADGTLSLYKKQNKDVDGIGFSPAMNIQDVPSSITAICLSSQYPVSSGTFYKVWGLKKKNV